MRFVRYQHQPDVLPQQPAASIFDDDSGDWWAGTARCFVQVAAASALTANALAAQLPLHSRNQPDELPPQPTAVAEDAHLPQRPLQAGSRVVAFSVEDELAALSVHDDGQWPQPLASHTGRTLPFTPDEELPPQPTPVIADDDSSWPRPTRITARSSPAASTDDEIAPAITVDDDSAWPQPHRASTWAVRPFIADDDLPIAPPPPPLDDGDTWPRPVHAPTKRAVAFEEGDALPALSVDEEGYSPRVSHRQQQLQLSPWSDATDEIVPQPAVGLDDGAQPVLRPLVYANSRSVQPWSWDSEDPGYAIALTGFGELIDIPAPASLTDIAAAATLANISAPVTLSRIDAQVTLAAIDADVTLTHIDAPATLTDID